MIEKLRRQIAGQFQHLGDAAGELRFAVVHRQNDR